MLSRTSLWSPVRIPYYKAENDLVLHKCNTVRVASYFLEKATDFRTITCLTYTSGKHFLNWPNSHVKQSMLIRGDNTLVAQWQRSKYSPETDLWPVQRKAKGKKRVPNLHREWDTRDHSANATHIFTNHPIVKQSKKATHLPRFQHLPSSPSCTQENYPPQPSTTL